MITWKDAATTILMGGVAVITYAKMKGWEWPLFSSWRISTLIIFLLGIGMCAVGTAAVDKGAWSMTAGILGGLSLVLLLIGLVTDSSLVFYLLAADILLLWASTTVRHFVAA